VTDQGNVRELALSVLLDVTSEKEYSHIALKEVLEKYQYLEKTKRAFLVRSVEGTLEHLLLLDYVLNQCASVPVSKMKPTIRDILRLGVHELKYMDSVPASATCNEMVKLAKKKGFRNLAGFVNGVLRNVSRSLSNIKWPDEQKEPIRALSIETSIQEWVLNQWESDYGTQKMFEIARALDVQPPMTVRVNRTLLTAKALEEEFQKEQVSYEKAKDAEDAYYISGIDSLQKLSSFQKGYFYVQDVSSMQVAKIAEQKAKTADFVLDVCGAPGGKALHLAQYLKEGARVLTRDLTPYKTDLIRQNIARCHIKNVDVQEWDARRFDESLRGKADIVLADLPCSGLGIMAKKKEIRYRMTREKEQELSLLQAEILSVCAQYVKQDGLLLYSTCTIDKMENEDNCRRFLKEHPDFSLMEERKIAPIKGERDGFYIAVMRKTK
jgi:16S rRNA (cytosine967-C5)-methyltransferase